MTEMEHRCGFRRPASMRVIVRTRKGDGDECLISNISASGALLCGPAHVSVHSLVLIQFPRVGRYVRQARSVIPAEVVRHAHGGFAVEWTEFSPPEVRSIIRELSGEAAAHPLRVANAPAR